MVDTKQEVVLLDFTPIEAAIYEHLKIKAQLDRNEQSVREFCCKLNYDWGQALEAMRTFMHQRASNDVFWTKGRIIDLKKALKDSQKMLKSPYVRDWERRSAQRTVEEYPKNLAQQEQYLKDYERVRKIFAALVSILVYSLFYFGINYFIFRLHVTRQSSNS